MESGRVPSWKAVAIAILRNDHNLHSLGFQSIETDTSKALLDQQRAMKGDQLWLPFKW